MEGYFPVGYYVIAPNGLPKPILDKLLAVSRTIVESDEFKSFLKANGYTSDPKIGDDMKKELAGYDQKFREVVKFLDDEVTPARSSGCRRRGGSPACSRCCWPRPTQLTPGRRCRSGAGTSRGLRSSRSRWRR